MGFLEEAGGILRILYLGTRNTIDSLEDAAFTKSNTTGNAQIVANTTTAGIEKVGVLAGSVLAQKGDGVVGAAGTAGAADKVVGITINDAAGNAFESSSAAASGKGVYVHNMGVYETNIYETADTAGNTIMASYVAGAKLYSSQNGLLTVEAGLAGGTAPAGSTIIGMITKAPTASDPYMRFNLKI